MALQFLVNVHKFPKGGDSYKFLLSVQFMGQSKGLFIQLGMYDFGRAFDF